MNLVAFGAGKEEGCFYNIDCLSQSDKPNIYLRLRIVQRNLLDLPQTMLDFPLMQSASGTFDHMTEDMATTE